MGLSIRAAYLNHAGGRPALRRRPPPRAPHAYPEIEIVVQEGGGRTPHAVGPFETVTGSRNEGERSTAPPGNEPRDTETRAEITVVGGSQMEAMTFVQTASSTTTTPDMIADDNNHDNTHNNTHVHAHGDAGGPPRGSTPPPHPA